MMMMMMIISKLVGALSPVNHRGLHQGYYYYYYYITTDNNNNNNTYNNVGVFSDAV